MKSVRAFLVNALDRYRQKVDTFEIQLFIAESQLEVRGDKTEPSPSLRPTSMELYGDLQHYFALCMDYVDFAITQGDELRALAVLERLYNRLDQLKGCQNCSQPMRCLLQNMICPCQTQIHHIKRKCLY